MNLSYFIFS